ncbi:hypothetical protein [Kribbella sp. NPDC048915]
MQILAALMTLAGAVLLTSLWKQVLKLLLAAAVAVFCFGLYNIAQVLTR